MTLLSFLRRAPASPGNLPASPSKLPASHVWWGVDTGAGPAGAHGFPALIDAEPDAPVCEHDAYFFEDDEYGGESGRQVCADCFATLNDDD